MFGEDKELCIYRSYLLENLPEKLNASGFDQAGPFPNVSIFASDRLPIGTIGNFLGFVLYGSVEQKFSFIIGPGELVLRHNSF